MTKLSLKSLLAATLLSAAIAQDAEQKPLIDYECVHPPYKAHLFSRSPLVIYLTDFLTPSERAHMLSSACAFPLPLPTFPVPS